jgi:hypothetical protein
VKRVWATALMLGVVLSSAGEGATTDATPKHHTLKAKKPLIHYAPADEYFGSSKMSLLGIRNQLHDLSLQYDLDHTARTGIYHKALIAEASLRDWAKKYPMDTPLARDVYLLDHLYGKIDLAEAKKRQPAIEHWLLNKYPATWYGKDERKRLVYEKTHPQREIPDKPAPSTQPFIGLPTPAASAMPQGSPNPVISASPSPMPVTPGMP